MLLAGHGHPHLAFGVGDEVAGQVDGDGVQGAGERERGLVVRNDRGAGVGSAGEAAGIEGDGCGDRELAVGDELAVDVQLGPAGGALAVCEVGFPGGLELEAELMPARREPVRACYAVDLAADVLVGVVQPAVLDEEGPAAAVAALGDEDALGSAVRDLRVGGDAVRPVEDARADPERQRLGVGPIDVLGPWLGDLPPRVLLLSNIVTAPICSFVPLVTRDTAASDGKRASRTGQGVPQFVGSAQGCRLRCR